MKGTVLWFNPEIGFGFLKNSENGEEIYFHWSSIISDKEYKVAFTGEPVNFERRVLTVDNAEKVEAINVEILERKSRLTGKPVLLVAYVNVNGEISLNEMHHRVSRFANAGLTFVNDMSGYLISADHSISNVELKEVLQVIVSNYDEIEANIVKGVRKVYTVSDNFKYDIIFL